MFIKPKCEITKRKMGIIETIKIQNASFVMLIFSRLLTEQLFLIIPPKYSEYTSAKTIVMAPTKSLIAIDKESLVSLKLINKAWVNIIP